MFLMEFNSATLPLHRNDGKVIRRGREKMEGYFLGSEVFADSTDWIALATCSPSFWLPSLVKWTLLSAIAYLYPPWFHESIQVVHLQRLKNILSALIHLTPNPTNLLL
jgi:hypothetical protein